MERKVDFSEFTQLLQTLENSDTSIRLRLTAEAWMDFSSVVLLSEHAMLIQRNGQRTLINLRHVVEFEIDKPVGEYSADCVYVIGH